MFQEGGFREGSTWSVDSTSVDEIILVICSKKNSFYFSDTHLDGILSDSFKIVKALRMTDFEVKP